MRRHRLSIAGLLQAAAFLTIAFSLCTLLPSDHYLLQLFTHFRLQYLVVTVLLLVVFAILRDLRYIAALAATALLNAALVVPWYFDRAPVRGSAPLTLLHANVLSTNTEHDAFLDLVAAEQPDLVVLQEVTPQWETVLRTLVADYPQQFVEARNDNFGIALLSRLPIVTASAVDSPPLGHPTIIADLVHSGRQFRIVASHPTIPVSRQLYDARNRQLENLVELVRLAKGPRILVGDLNVTMWDTNYRSLEARSGLRNARRGFGVAPTWPTFFPVAMIPIDHVLVSDDIGVVDVRTGPRIGSDHLPLLVTLAL